MRISSLCLVLMLVCSAGCYSKRTKAERPTSPKEPDLIQRVAGKVKLTVTAFEMKDLQLFIAQIEIATNKMPSKEEILEYAKKENPKLWKLLDDGTIVLTGTKTRESVWAYEKDGLTRKGWVITHVGESQMEPEELKQKLGM